MTGVWVIGGWDNWFMVDAIFADEKSALASNGQYVLFVEFGQEVQDAAVALWAPHGLGKGGAQ